MNALAKTEILPFQMRGSIFLVEKDEVAQASFFSLPEEETAPCQRISPGECLCGLALTTGEIIVSKDRRTDPRHTADNPCIAPHGRIAIPLKAAGRIVGILAIYAETGTELSERMIHLLATIGRQIGTAIDNARLYEETKNSSLHDALTGMPNRRLMEIQFAKAFEAARRYGEDLSAIMLDIDLFKSYNDTLGHAEGDKLLVRLAGILMRDIRCTDYVFRYGGEEFLVILPRTNPRAAREVAERLRKTVEAETGSTVSLGVASLDDSMPDKEELIREADAALYRAKRHGRNRVEATGDRGEAA
jgi:diguanylate cyclase (GGDEF)-like protein